MTPWTAARQAFLSITISRSPPKPISIKLIMPSNYLILYCPLLFLPSIFLSIRVFSNESAFASGGQSIGVSASTSVLPMSTQDWSPLGWPGWISLQSKGPSRVFSNTTVQKYQFGIILNIQISLVQSGETWYWIYWHKCYKMIFYHWTLHLGVPFFGSWQLFRSPSSPNKKAGIETSQSWISLNQNLWGWKSTFKKKAFQVRQV